MNSPNGKADSGDGACQFFFVLGWMDEVVLDVVGGQLVDSVGVFNRIEIRVN